MLFVLGLFACREAQDRVTRVSSPADEYWFSTYCKREAQCRKDAKEICPNGYVPTPERDPGITRGEFFFKCHGKANW